MSFTCTFGGTPHQHHLAIEGRICYGLVPRPMPVASTPAIRPFEVHEPRITLNQLNYIKRLGGDETYASTLTKKQASAYIDKLQSGDPVTQTSRPQEDPRLAMLKELMVSIPSGYYAVEADEDVSTKFLRVSRPKVGTKRYGGSIKIQTQHGPRLEVAASIWPSGQFSVYDRRVVDMLMLLVVDYQGSALRYARKIGKCCRCNSPLTDERSRHYGIGPECETVFPWIIERVDEMNDGKPFEALAHR